MAQAVTCNGVELKWEFSATFELQVLEPECARPIVVAWEVGLLGVLQFSVALSLLHPCSLLPVVVVEQQSGTAAIATSWLGR